MTMFTQTLTIPRLDNFRTVLNTRFLPMFGSTWRNYEFNYVNPVPADAESERADLTAKTNAFKTLIDAGVSADDAAEVCGLPPMRVEKKPEPVPVAPGAPGGRPVNLTVYGASDYATKEDKGDYTEHGIVGPDTPGGGDDDRVASRRATSY